MAAHIRHVSKSSSSSSSWSRLLRLPFSNSREGPNGGTWNLMVVRGKKKFVAPKRVVTDQFEQTRLSLASRGFLRPLKPYKPPQDASERLDKICQQEGISSDDGTGVTDLLQRFQLFTACEKEFEYSLPNSLLTSIETIGDLRNFYKTPVNTTVPLDALRNEDLPKNLHVQYDYIRFHPDTDQLFDGKTAFPKSSTIVTGLKYRKKYPGHKQQDPWKI